MIYSNSGNPVSNQPLHKSEFPTVFLFPLAIELVDKPILHFRLIFSFSPNSIKPFSQQPYGGKPATAISGEIDAGHPSAQASWEGRTIATSKFRLLEFSAFMEVQREEMVSIPRSKSHISMASNVNDVRCFLLQYRHLFVHINGKASYSDPLLEVKSSIICAVVSSVLLTQNFFCSSSQ